MGALTRRQRIVRDENDARRGVVAARLTATAADLTSTATRLTTTAARLTRSTRPSMTGPRRKPQGGDRGTDLRSDSEGEDKSDSDDGNDDQPPRKKAKTGASGGERDVHCDNTQAQPQIPIPTYLPPPPPSGGQTIRKTSYKKVQQKEARNRNGKNYVYGEVVGITITVPSHPPVILPPLDTSLLDTTVQHIPTAPYSDLLEWIKGNDVLPIIKTWADHCIDAFDQPQEVAIVFPEDAELLDDRRSTIINRAHLYRLQPRMDPDYPHDDVVIATQKSVAKMSRAVQNQWSHWLEPHETYQLAFDLFHTAFLDLEAHRDKGFFGILLKSELAVPKKWEERKILEQWFLVDKTLDQVEERKAAARRLLTRVESRGTMTDAATYTSTGTNAATQGTAINTNPVTRAPTIKTNAVTRTPVTKNTPVRPKYKNEGSQTTWTMFQKTRAATAEKK